MPDQPPWLQRNFPALTQWWVMPCETTIIVYMECLLEALENVVITLLSFDLGDVVRGHFRPESIRRWRHGRKGRKGYFKKQFIPETGEVFAHWVDAIPPEAGRWEEQSSRLLWEIDGVSQEIFYHFMVFNIVQDFWYDVNYGIISHDKTKCGNLPRVQRKGSPDITGVQGWLALDLDILNWEVDMISDPFGVSVDQGQFVAILASKIFNKQLISEELTCGVRLRCNSVFGFSEDVGSIATIPRFATHTSIARLTFNGPASIEWEGFKEGAECEFQETTVNVFKISAD